MKKAIGQAKKGVFSSPGTLRDDCGFGYAVIPSDISRKEYLSNFYKTGSCMIITDTGIVLKDSLAQQDLIQLIKFPLDAGERGSLVGWTNIKRNNQIVIDAIYSERGNYAAYEEGKVIDSMTVNGRDVLIHTERNLNKRILSFIVKNKEDAIGGIFIKFLSDVISQLKLTPDGAEINSDTVIKLLAAGTQSITIDENGTLIKSDFVNLGDGEEPVPLGNKLQTELNKEKARIDSVLRAITNAPVTPQDGGLSFKTALVSALSALDSGNYTEVLSEVVKTK